jgi:hypothetical protein
VMFMISFSPHAAAAARYFIRLGRQAAFLYRREGDTGKPCRTFPF